MHAPVTPNNAYSTVFMNGNYDCAAGTFQWNSGRPLALPSSYYLSAKPKFFTSAPWPRVSV